MEERSLDGGCARIKFHTENRGTLHFHREVRNSVYPNLEALSRLLSDMESYGAAPVLPDGKVGGNAAILLPTQDGDPVLFVSKSGKKPGEKLNPEDFVIVNFFDKNAWQAGFQTLENSVENRPSSDSPLLWSSLQGYREYGWSRGPSVALHGHALADDASAERLGIPISPKETLFSTPEDLAALEELFRAHPFPESRIFVRKDHGFFLLADSLEEAERIFHEQIVPNISSERTE